MSAEISDPQPWSRRRWWVVVFIVFLVHLGFIFAFGDRKPITERPPVSTPRIGVARQSDELIALDDPTLFALPHRLSFAAKAWLQIPEVSTPTFRWSEPPRLLPLPVEQLGETFEHFMQTNKFGEFVFQMQPLPTPLPTTVPKEERLVVTNSTVRSSVELANRAWLNPPKLRSWSGADLLTNSVAQVVVQADGSVFSAKILPPGSGSSEADQFALKAAQAARFAPERSTPEKLVVGSLLFEWVTTPLPITNTPPARP